MTTTDDWYPAKYPDNEGVTLHWQYHPTRAFTVENVTPETELDDEWLRWLALHQVDEPRLELTAAPDNPRMFKGWLLKINADNQHVIYRIDEYLPEVNRWKARFPD